MRKELAHICKYNDEDFDSYFQDKKLFYVIFPDIETGDFYTSNNIKITQKLHNNEYFGIKISPYLLLEVYEEILKDNSLEEYAKQFYKADVSKRIKIIKQAEKYIAKNFQPS